MTTPIKAAKDKELSEKNIEAAVKAMINADAHDSGKYDRLLATSVQPNEREATAKLLRMRRLAKAALLSAQSFSTKPKDEELAGLLKSFADLAAFHAERGDMYSSQKIGEAHAAIIQLQAELREAREALFKNVDAPILNSFNNMADAIKEYLADGNAIQRANLKRCFEQADPLRRAAQALKTEGE